MAPEEFRYKLMMSLEKSFTRARDADSFLRMHVGTTKLDLISDKECEKLLKMLRPGRRKSTKAPKKHRKPDFTCPKRPENPI